MRENSLGHKSERGGISPERTTPEVYGGSVHVSAKGEGLSGKTKDTSPPCSFSGTAHTQRHNADRTHYKLRKAHASVCPPAGSPPCIPGDQHGDLFFHLCGFLCQAHLSDLWLQPTQRITRCCVIVRINRQEPTYPKKDFSGGTPSRHDLTTWPPRLLLVLVGGVSQAGI